MNHEIQENKQEFRLKRKDYIEWINSHIMLDKEQDSPSVSLTDEDWQNLYNIALEEGVAPYLYYCLKKSAPNLSVPPQTKQKFVIASRNVLARNTVLYHELGKILMLFSENGIPVIVLKGAYLSEIVYPHNGLRPMGDIDLLVKESDLHRTQEKLLEMGYTQSKNLSIEDQCAKSHHLIPFTNRDAIMVEIHWTLSRHLHSSSKIVANGLWKRARSVNIAGKNVLALSPEHLILHLCFHTSCHHLYILWLKSFFDIVEVTRHYQYEICWDYVQQCARSWNICRSIYITLHFVKELLRVDVPERVLVTLKQEDFNLGMINLISEKIFAERDKTPMDQRLAQLWGANRSKAKAILQILKIAFPPKVIIFRKYIISQNSPIVFLYYLVHLVDLFSRYNRSVLRLFRRDTEMMASVKRANRTEIELPPKHVPLSKLLLPVNPGCVPVGEA
jgi:hypothetical protein